MTPPPDLVECSNCEGLFAAASTDEVFYHATCRCRREATPRFSNRDACSVEFPSARPD